MESYKKSNTYSSDTTTTTPGGKATEENKQSDYDSNGVKLVFEVPCEIPNVLTAYRYVKQERIGQPTRFDRRYHGDFFPSSRTRFSLNYLSKRGA